MMSTDQQGYLAYLLRLWQVKIKGQIVWRASLENSLTGERLGFACLVKLFDYLEREIKTASDSEEINIGSESTMNLDK